LDACIAINLLATDRVEEIAKVLDLRFLMVRQAATECGELHVVGEDVVVRRRGASAETPPLAEVLTLVESEVDAYVELARDIDDGEAATIAIARSRSLDIATDDRKARRVAVEIGLARPTSTTSILRAYAEVNGLTHQETAAVLQCVRDEASYIPRHTDENSDWWQQAICP
jgi:predicted nucleic acid-binding protein